jgi:hypothetical protein
VSLYAPDAAIFCQGNEPKGPDPSVNSAGEKSVLSSKIGIARKNQTFVHSFASFIDSLLAYEYSNMKIEHVFC